MDEPRPFGAPNNTQLPGEALPLVWLLVIGAVALWWLLPFLERLRAPSPLGTPAPAVVRGASVAAANSRVGSPGGAPPEQDAASWGTGIVSAKTGSGSTVSDLTGISLSGEFSDTFTSAIELIDQVLQVSPQGPEYNRATGALRRLSDILDTVFRAWGSDELSRVCRLNEDAPSFNSAFGCANGQDNTVVCKLLGLAGFERQPPAQEAVGTGSALASKGVWVLQSANSHCRLRAMTVRLCLQKYDELQRRRGSKVWTQASNEDVIPKPGSAVVTELFGLYCSDGGSSVPAIQLSLKERNTEAEVRAELNRRRTTATPLGLHGGLAAVARSLAASSCLRARSAGKTGGSRPQGPSDSDVNLLLPKLPLPPGFTAIRLHCVTDELPHVFGMASTKGDGEGASDSDKAASIIANEVGNSWAAWQSTSLTWPFGLVCGVGVSLDYTMNRGFVVAIIAGFDGVMPQAELAAAARQERLELKQRQDSAKEHRSTPGFGAKVQGIQDSAPAPLRRRKGG